MNDDTISRQAVLKLLSTMPPEEATTKAMLIQSVKQMSAAQPEKRTDKRTETHACDLISRAAAIDAIFGRSHEIIKMRIGNLPSAQPDEEKISDTLYSIYRNTSPHSSAEGVAAIKYYIREIYREIYGEEGPRWMKK